ncbi:MAG: agmatine deiminase family protein [Phycisphaeraceae bacterium]|nr:agmatine deiminase family protein [Phycisphaeraceae bacterium]
MHPSRAVVALLGSAFVSLSLTSHADDGRTFKEADPPLTRVREGGTPFDPNQSLIPYAISTGIAAAPDTGLIVSPPEYDPVRGVIFRYSTGAWPSVVRACVKALTQDPAHDDIAYVVVASQAVANSAAAAFASDGADLSKVVFIIQPTDSIWMRDYGPHFIWQEGTKAIVDSHYYPQRKFDNFIPTLVGRDNFIVPTYDIGLYYSGGNFMMGPNREAFVTALINLDNPASQGFNLDLIKEFYGRFQGVDTLHVLPQLPTTVDGTGHIDMWMYIVDEQNVIISQFIPGSNASAINITNNAVTYMQNLGFTVHRPQAWNAGGTHFTYANAFRVNNRIFVPVYGTAIVPGGNSAYNTRDADAMAKWQAAAGPGVEIIPIQCSSIIGASGAIHCIVKQVPRYVDSMPSAHVIAPAGGEVWLSGTTETIRWNATDTNNRALADVDLLYSLDNGVTWSTIASGLPDSGSFEWTVPAGNSQFARVQVVVRSVGGATVAAVSKPYRHAPGTLKVYNFGSGAGSQHFATGHQTSNWSPTINGNLLPVTLGLTTANYAALAASDANGGNTDPNRFQSPTISTGNRSTHVFRFAIQEHPQQIDELRILWEGYADRCTQVELYVWDYSKNNWGDGGNLVGQNRFADSFAGNSDGVLNAYIRENIGNFVGPDGVVRYLVRAQRTTDRTFHDYTAVHVKMISGCITDLDGNGVTDGADLAILLGQWGGSGTADLNGDGTVNGADLAILLGAWGICLN